MRNSPIKSDTPLYEGKTILKLGIFENIPEPEWGTVDSLPIVLLLSIGVGNPGCLHSPSRQPLASDL